MRPPEQLALAVDGPADRKTPARKRSARAVIAEEMTHGRLQLERELLRQRARRVVASPYASESSRKLWRAWLAREAAR